MASRWSSLSRSSLLEESASELARRISHFARVEVEASRGEWLSNNAGDKLFCRKSSSMLVLANWCFLKANQGQGTATRVLDHLELDMATGGVQQVMFIEDVRNRRFYDFLTRRAGWASCTSKQDSDANGTANRYSFEHAGNSCVFSCHGDSFVFGAKPQVNGQLT